MPAGTLAAELAPYVFAVVVVVAVVALIAGIVRYSESRG